MIKYNTKTWFRHIIAFQRSDTFVILWKELIYISILALVLTYVEINYIENHEPLDKLIGVYSIIGFVLSLLLVFRTNTAYDRWWEGRKKWGEMVNNTRNLAIKISAMTNDAETKDFFSRMIPNYVYAMKEHLRNGVKIETLDLTQNEREILEPAGHKPNLIARLIYERLQKMKRENMITQEEFLSIDVNLKTFSDIIGACERIKNTPIPYSYSIFLKKFIFLYVTTLPLAFVNAFGYFSAILAVFVFYVLVSLEVLAEEIEDPFGLDDNDLPTDELSDKIKANVKEIFG